MDPLYFKFKWLDRAGNVEGGLAKKGSFDGNVLVLDETEIPAVVILEADFRAQFMLLTVLTEDDEPAQLVFTITKGSARRLKESLGQARSEAWAKLHREELEKEGRGHTYRDAQCPHCQATVNLTGMEPTPQVSCEFCHTIGTVDTTPRADGSVGPWPGEEDYRLCDECGMFSKPRKFTIFYFYFLLVFWGYSSQPTWRCPGCMRAEAWKMLFGNVLFVLGIPISLIQLFRSYGGTDIGGLYPGLDSANLKARKGNFQGAVNDYQTILEKQPTAAGVKYNIGLAFLQQGDEVGAARMFEYALADCANYQPAAAVLAGCYESLGETEKLAELKEQWGIVDEEEPEGGEGVAAEEV